MTFTKHSRLIVLEALRFFATVHIFLFHYAQSYFERAPVWVRNVLGAGYYSTSIFFMLSGFILFYVYFDEDRGGLRISSLAFFQRRLYRLYPFHLLGFIFTVVPTVIGQSRAGFNVSRAALNLSLLQAWIPDLSVVLSFNRISWSASALLFL
jgi:peptidoglycan/LPS O-acetylase OafA/YrhL